MNQMYIMNQSESMISTNYLLILRCAIDKMLAISPSSFNPPFSRYQYENEIDKICLVMIEELNQKAGDYYDILSLWSQYPEQKIELIWNRLYSGYREQFEFFYGVYGKQHRKRLNSLFDALVNHPQERIKAKDGIFVTLFFLLITISVVFATIYFIIK